MRTPSVSVIVPARNEERNISWVLEHMPLEVDEVILVDGRSTDRTVEVARAVRPDIVVVRDDAPGKGCAIRKGIETAKGDFVVMLDADGSMDPREIGRFIRPLREGADMVRGSRFLHGGGTEDMSLLRKSGNWGFLVVTRILYGVKRSDLCYGYAAFRRSRLLTLDLDATGFEIEAQMFLRADRARFNVVEVPSFESSRRAGRSNLHTMRDGWRVLRTILRERFRPVHPLAEVVAFPIATDGAQEEAFERVELGHAGAPRPTRPERVLRLRGHAGRRRETLVRNDRIAAAALLSRHAASKGAFRTTEPLVSEFRSPRVREEAGQTAFALDRVDALSR